MMREMQFKTLVAPKSKNVSNTESLDYLIPITLCILCVLCTLTLVALLIRCIGKIPENKVLKKH